MADLIPIGGTMELMGQLFVVAGHRINRQGVMAEYPGQHLGAVNGKPPPPTLQPDGSMTTKTFAPPAAPVAAAAPVAPVAAAAPVAPVAAAAPVVVPPAPPPAPPPVKCRRPASVSPRAANRVRMHGVQQLYARKVAQRKSKRQFPQPPAAQPPAAQPPAAQPPAAQPPAPAPSTSPVLLWAVIVGLLIVIAGLMQAANVNQNHIKAANAIRGNP